MRTDIETIREKIKNANGYIDDSAMRKHSEAMSKIIWSAEDERDQTKAELNAVYERVGMYVGQAVDAKLELVAARAQQQIEPEERIELNRLRGEIALFHGTFMTEVNDPAVMKSTALAWEENALQTTLAAKPNFYLARLIADRLEELATERVELARLDRERSKLRKEMESETDD